MASQQNPDSGRDLHRRGRLWRRGLPVLADRAVTLREVRVSDAAALLEHLSSRAVLDYVAPPPSTAEGFRRYIRWARRERRHQRHASFALIPNGHDEPVGVIQMWPIEPGFETAEWGFVIDPNYWGSDLFGRGARLLLTYLFGEVGVHRLEARVSADNERGQAVLQKLGARREMVLRGAFKCQGVYKDHVMWSILADEWDAGRSPEV